MPVTVSAWLWGLWDTAADDGVNQNVQSAPGHKAGRAFCFWGIAVAVAREPFVS